METRQVEISYMVGDREVTYVYVYEVPRKEVKSSEEVKTS